MHFFHHTPKSTPLLFTLLRLNLLFLTIAVVASIRYALQPLDGIFVINRPIGHAKYQTNGDPHAPGVKDVGEVLEDVAVYPPHGTKQDYDVIKEIF